MPRPALLALVLALSACASGDDGDDAVTMRTPSSSGLVAPIDAGAAARRPARPHPAPSNDGWLDPPPADTRWGGTGAPARTRESRPLAIQLRSTPPGATVMVDGRTVGSTPTYWEGMADGKAHDFVFILADHAVAHYRFVPVQDGHLHPRLDRLLEPELIDAGIPGPPRPAP